MNTSNEGNSPVLNRSGFPLIVVRYPYNRQSRPREHYDNQYASYMLIDTKFGFTPPEWCSHVGPVLIYRPQIGGQSVQNFNKLDFEILWDFFCNLLDRFSDGLGAVVANRDFSFERLRGFTENYIHNHRLNGREVRLEEQNITKGEF